jgi:hypothetical protein
MLGNASRARNALLEAYPARHLNVLPALLNDDQFAAGVRLGAGGRKPEI